MIEKTENKQNLAGPGWPIYKNTSTSKLLLPTLKAYSIIEV